MTTKKITVLITAFLAVATVLATGLTVLPSSVQDAQAEDPCHLDTTDIDAEEVGINCEFYGPLEIDASSRTQLPDRIPFPE